MRIITIHYHSEYSRFLRISRKFIIIYELDHTLSTTIHLECPWWTLRQDVIPRKLDINDRCISYGQRADLVQVYENNPTPADSFIHPFLNQKILTQIAYLSRLNGVVITRN